MALTLPLEEAKNRLAEVLQAAARGEEVVIRVGDELLRLSATPLPLPKKRGLVGSSAGKIRTSLDFDEPLEHLDSSSILSA